MSRFGRSPLYPCHCYRSEARAHSLGAPHALLLAHTATVRAHTPSHSRHRFAELKRVHSLDTFETLLFFVLQQLHECVGLFIASARRRAAGSAIHASQCVALPLPAISRHLVCCMSFISVLHAACTCSCLDWQRVVQVAAVPRSPPHAFRHADICVVRRRPSSARRHWTCVTRPQAAVQSAYTKSAQHKSAAVLCSHAQPHAAAACARQPQRAVQAAPAPRRQLPVVRSGSGSRSRGSGCARVSVA